MVLTVQNRGLGFGFGGEAKKVKWHVQRTSYPSLRFQATRMSRQSLEDQEEMVGSCCRGTNKCSDLLFGPPGNI